jgi:hypothetical protein
MTATAEDPRAQALTPKLGDCVEDQDGTRSVISASEAEYGEGWLGICELGAASIFYGPDGHGGATEYVSVSGGPHPAVRIAQLELAGEAVIRCWRWKDRPRAGGGEDYQRTVPLWRIRP